MKTLALNELEAVYDALAAAINQVGSTNESLFLSKLALVLANQMGDQAMVEQAIQIALQDLEDA